MTGGHSYRRSRAGQIPTSRYSYTDLGICVLVSDGLSKDVLSVTYEQACELIEQPHDNSRDALFHIWQQAARDD